MRVDINDEKMIITGKYGEYEIGEFPDGGFLVSVLFHSFVTEIDETGDTYLLEKGNEWKVHATGLSEINSFITTCEEAKLWNVLKGIVYRVKIDDAKGILYIRGAKRNYIIGEESGKIFMDETLNQKPHCYVSGLQEISREIIQHDKWWKRNPDEIIDILENPGSLVEIMDSGHFRFRLKNIYATIGQKEDGSFWTVIGGENEKHAYRRDSLKEIFKIVNAGGSEN